MVTILYSAEHWYKSYFFFNYTPIDNGSLTDPFSLAQYHGELSPNNINLSSWYTSNSQQRHTKIKCKMPHASILFLPPNGDRLSYRNPAL